MIRERKWLVTYSTAVAAHWSDQCERTQVFGMCLTIGRRRWWRPRFDYDLWREEHPGKVIVSLVEI